MTLSEEVIVELAGRLDRAESDGRAIARITEAYPHMDLADAYAVQVELRRRKQARGVRIVGLKAGLTSFAKMAQMGVSEPVTGFLTDYGAVPDGGVVDTRTLIHPRVEAEIGFVLKRPLRGPGCHIGDVLAATDFIIPAAEIIDSRYENFKLDLKSTIADNTSAARFVTGGRACSPLGLDLRNLGIVMEKNGEVVATASASAVLGHPAQSVAMMANMAGTRGDEIPQGILVMTGGATEAIAVQAGDSVTVRYQELGSISVRFI